MRRLRTGRAVIVFLLPIGIAWAASQPILFEPNRGQSGPGVRFIAHTPEGALLLTPDAAVLRLPDGSRVALAPVKGKRHPDLVAEEPTGGVSHYLRGQDQSRWITDVPHFRRVRYREVYPGIDQVFYGSAGALEYDLIVRPGADPRAIRLRIDGTRHLSLDAAGDLRIQAGATRLVQHRPAVYQEDGGRRRPVWARFALAGNQVRFMLGRYDHRLPLVIDPALRFGGYLGGQSLDLATAVAVDASGSAYVAGSTVSADFPVTSNALQIKHGGVPNNGVIGVLQNVFDAFVAKYSPDGSRLIYATFLGGTGNDQATAIAVDAAGNAVVGGFTSSTDFPMANGAIQSANPSAGSIAGFVSKLNAAGSNLIFSTYLGGSGGNTAVQALTVDRAGSPYVAGYTASPAFPVTQGALQTTFGGGQDAFVAKLNPPGTALVYATFLGGKATDQAAGIAVDSAGNAYVAGETASADFPVPGGSAPAALKGFTDSFVCKLNTTGSALIYAAFLGGSQSDNATSIALDSDNSAVFAGATLSPDFPTSLGAFQPTPGSKNGTAFVARLDATGAIAFATLLGGSAIDSASAVAVAADGSAIVAGTTTSKDFPVTSDAYQRAAPPGVGCGTFSLMFVTYNAACSDAFLTIVHVSGRRLIYSTFLGGAASDSVSAMALGPDGAIYLTGSTGSDDFPVTAGAFRTSRSGGTCTEFASPSASDSSPCPDAFLLKIDPNTVGPPRPVAAIVNAVNAVGGPVAPGEFVALYGFGIGPPQPGTGQIGPDGKLSTTIAGTTVTFDGVAAPLLYAGPNQINAIVPYAVAGKTSTTVHATTPSYSAGVATMAVGLANPGLMSTRGQGQGQAAALNQDGSLNGDPSLSTCILPGCGPAAPGSIITLFGDGAGAMLPPGVEGAIASTLSLPAATVTAAIGYLPAQVIYAGAAPTLLQGILQVNAIIPANVVPGPQVPVFITIAGVTSQPYIYIAVR